MKTQTVVSNTLVCLNSSTPKSRNQTVKSNEVKHLPTNITIEKQDLHQESAVKDMDFAKKVIISGYCFKFKYIYHVIKATPADR